MRLVLRDVRGFRSCRVLCLWADYVHLPDEITGRGSGDRCGYLLVQGSHDGIHPVYYKTEIRTFFFYYYKNVGMSIRWLWGMALVFDFLTYVVCMLIAYQL